MLSILWVLHWVAIYCLAGIGDNSLVFQSSPHVSGCLVVKGTLYSFAANIVIGAFETIILVTTIIRAFQARRCSVGLSQSSVVTVLYRDALLNYVYVLILANLFSVLFISSYAPVLLLWERIGHAIIGSRTLLDLRQASEIPNNRTTGRTEMRILSTISFQRPQTRRSTTRSIVEGIVDDMEEWLAPDPELYPRAAAAASSGAPAVFLEFADTSVEFGGVKSDSVAWSINAITDLVRVANDSNGA